jgi:arylsulfatase A-like enzyme
MPEIPGNGKDDNCMGGDAPLPDTGAGSAGAVGSGSGSGGGAVAAPAGPHTDNVLVIFVDTLRYDHLGFTGYRRDGASVSPRIDALAAKSVAFRCAFSQAPNTPRSVPSFMSSRYPSQVHFDKQYKSYAEVLDDNDLMFEQLKAAGLATFGESSHFYFCNDKKRPRDCDYPNPKHSNIDQGVDVWDNSEAVDIMPSNHDIAGPRIAKKTIAKLDELAASKQRFAMLVHLFDPHSTYMEHPGFTYKGHGREGLMEKYDYEIAFDDQHIGAILDELDKTGLAANTAVIVMADHGEAFGEHTVYGQADYFHGDTLYAELIHVPLIVRVPGAATGCMRDDVVQLVDLAPTVAGLVGAAPAASWVGRNLAPALACERPSTLPAKPAFAEMLPEPMWDHDAKAMVTADCTHEVYNRISDGRVEIYDLTSDPVEKKDVSDEAGADALKAQLGSWIEGPLAAGRGRGGR